MNMICRLAASLIVLFRERTQIIHRSPGSAFLAIYLVLCCATLGAASTPDAVYLEDGTWKLTDAASVSATPESVSNPGFDTAKWTPALVPGTVLASYIAAGKAADPNFGNQQTLNSDAFYNQDFWYRDDFTVPASYAGRKVFLNFDGINWKADVYVNGALAGQIAGAFIRGKFDITNLIHPGNRNTVAVLIHTVVHPGAIRFRILYKQYPVEKDRILARDGPTFYPSLGWNWLPTIRGRDIGIWNHVYITATGAVQIVDPFISTDVSPDLNRAEIKLKVDLRNSSNQPVDGVLQGNFGDIAFSRKVHLSGTEVQSVSLDSSSAPQLSVSKPALWWPNGYGAQPLYKLDLTFRTGTNISDETIVRFGIRKITYDTTKGLKILVNGHLILCDGGNWGMDESMLRYGKADYDAVVKYHKDMHLVMIRNWQGMTEKDEFFDACDEDGILVWNDFYQANPVDGPEPDDVAMYIANLRDTILRIRNHPCLAVYCGRNEASPVKTIAAALISALTPQTSPGAEPPLDDTRIYIPSSRGGLVTGGGPYDAHTPDWYFANRGTTFHTELGLVCVPTADTMRLTMPEQDLWPISDDWAVHDYYQPRAKSYTKQVFARYGESADIDDFCQKAQLLNLETSKAMLECWRSNRGGGGLIWMTHPAWPSLICQVYDYFKNPTAAYFGIKKASEPIHIFWNSHTNAVEVANDTLNDLRGATASAAIYNMDGSIQWKTSAPVTVESGTVTSPFSLEYPPTLSPVHFIKLTLTRAGNPVSDNFYWRGSGLSNVDYTAAAQMKPVTLTQTTSRRDSGGTTFLTTTVTNPTGNIALAVELKTVGSNDAHRRIAPILYEDNYFSLLPNESRTIHTQFATSLLRNGDPVVQANAWNSAGSGKLECENLDIQSVTPGATSRILDKSALSGNAAVLLDGTNAGQQITFVTPKIAPGAYDVKIGMEKLNTGGIWQLRACPASSPANGTDIGSRQDSYSPGDASTTIDLGKWNVAVPGPQWLRFSITGRNVSSRGFRVGFHYISLSPE